MSEVSRHPRPVVGRVACNLATGYLWTTLQPDKSVRRPGDGCPNSDSMYIKPEHERTRALSGTETA